MADMTKANTAEVKYGVSQVTPGTYHISLFVDKYDAQGNLDKRTEIRADPEHRLEDFSAEGFIANEGSFGDITVTVDEPDEKSLENFGNFDTDPDHLVTGGLSHAEADRLGCS